MCSVQFKPQSSLPSSFPFCKIGFATHPSPTEISQSPSFSLTTCLHLLSKERYPKKDAVMAESLCNSIILLYNRNVYLPVRLKYFIWISCGPILYILSEKEIHTMTCLTVVFPDHFSEGRHFSR